MRGPTLATMVVVGAVGKRVVDMMCGLGSWGAKTIERLEYFGALKIRSQDGLWMLLGFFWCLQSDGRKSQKKLGKEWKKEPKRKERCII